MKTFRYDMTGSWFKGNVHLHSKASDGGATFAELATLYAQAGYSFLCRTDHWVASDTSQDAGPAPLLWLDGIELDDRKPNGTFRHILCLGLVRNISRENGLAASVQAARDQGALIVLAHPTWSGNAFSDCEEFDVDGVEVYNHVCRWLNGKSDGVAHWNHRLLTRPNSLGFAVDDTHMRVEHPGWKGGWIVVNASELSAPAIMAAIRRGNFYSSCGPEFHSIELDGENLRVRTSPIRFARLAGPTATGMRQGSFDGPLMTEFKAAAPHPWSYAYLEIEDDQGRRAWTNALFLPDESG